MKRRNSLTLIEVMVAIALLGMLLTGLFQCLRQTMKKSIVASQLKQKVLQQELIDQRVRSLFSQLMQDTQGSILWLQDHPDARGLALMINYAQEVDPDPLFIGSLQGMFYLDSKGRFSFASWGKKDGVRVETLIDRLQRVRWEFFDPTKGKWVGEWPKKQTRIPAMVRLHLKTEKEEIPYVFILDQSDDPIQFIAPPGKVS